MWAWLTNLYAGIQKLNSLRNFQITARRIVKRLQIRVCLEIKKIYLNVVEYGIAGASRRIPRKLPIVCMNGIETTIQCIVKTYRGVQY